MRVCMVAYTFYEGDNRVRRYAESLRRRGDEVDAIVLRQPKSSSFCEVSGVNVYKIQKRDIDEKRQIDYLIKLLLFLFRSAVMLTKLHFKKQRYDLIHVHSVPDFEVFAALIPKLFGAKIVLDIHDIVPELFASKFGAKHGSLLFKMLVFVERASMAFADHVIVANHIWHERLISRSVSSKKCSVVMNYPDTHIFTCESSRRIKNGSYIMVYPGTLSIHQGLETAIRAVEMLKKEIPELQLHIYGKGTDEGYFQSLVKELKLEKQVFFNGIVPIEKLPQVISGADIGVEPKLSRTFGNEAFSTKILEFMAMGVPVIASDTLVHKHYFDETLVQFFRSEDVSDLADRILLLRKSSSLRSKLVTNSFKFMKEYNWEAKKHLYHSMVDALVKDK
ncbi:MAG: glycosyltransferase family 4 protein [Chitinispirillia bacterium]|nr:glycosyltransferase family 4 protein [Chitinispirillia bacterium]